MPLIQEISVSLCPFAPDPALGSGLFSLHEAARVSPGLLLPIIQLSFLHAVHFLEVLVQAPPLEHTLVPVPEHETAVLII